MKGLVVVLALLPATVAWSLQGRAPRWAAAPALRAVKIENAPLQPANYYEATLCEDDEEEDEVCDLPGEADFTVAILGDLHFDPRKMEDYYTGREHFLPILADARSRGVSTCVVSLGDLGESKSVRPTETDELFAGTTACHELAADFLGSFDGNPYEVIWGNHDLEGIDEFKTDEENLAMALEKHGKPTPQFVREIAEKTLLVGLSSTVFRDARYTSHEVTVDDVQIAWFEDLLQKHPAEEGWKVFVFTHAPPIGSGLRVLQENHVINGCCWLNHSAGKKTAKFIELVRKHRCIKAWFSGHFHLGQDYQDSITFPTIPKEQGPYPNRGSCVFAQTSVMRSGSSRDKRQQSRLLRGNQGGFEICTVNHQAGGTVRLDATVSYKDKTHEVGTFAHEHADLLHDNFIKVYSPTEGDAHQVFRRSADGDLDASRGAPVTMQTVAWWRLNCGRVMGVYDGRLIEYEPSTLAPLGLVVGADELLGRTVVVLASGDDRSCRVDTEAGVEGMEGADCADQEDEEQAVLLVTEDPDDPALAGGVPLAVTVVQPNEDGSYWRKIVRNKMVRMKEKRRVQAASHFAKQAAAGVAGGGSEAAAAEPFVVSSWGPYTSISGTAKNTGVNGVTKKAK